MNEQNILTTRFESNRNRLRSVAYRMLGSLSDAEDAVQEAWLRLMRIDSDVIDNLDGWLTTVVSRICLDMLRSRKTRSEEPHEEHLSEERSHRIDPEAETVMAESVGLALLVLLERLNPAERIAFVLHELCGVSFENVAATVGRTTTAARQLASRARRRVHGATVENKDLNLQRKAISTFLAALRSGDIDGLMTVLDPQLVVSADVGPNGKPSVVRGAQNWAKGAVAFKQFARFIDVAIVNGSPGLVVAPKGELARVLEFKYDAGKITEFNVITIPEELKRIDLALFDAEGE